MDIESIFSVENVDWFKDQVTVNHSFWAIAALALIPFCVILFVRELWCWFFKINQLSRSLRQIEQHLRAQVEFIDSQRRAQVERRQSAPQPPLENPIHPKQF